jgi:peptide/nickel transport system permease protein
MIQLDGRRAPALAGAILLGLLILAAAVSLFWTPYDPLAFNLDARLQSPSLAHVFGTDEFGRDVLSRLIVGARISGAIALCTIALSGLAGTAIGLISGFVGGWLDRALMAATDALLAFPGILLALALTVIVGGGPVGLVIAMSLAYLPTVVRVVRSAVLSVRQREFIEASMTMGNSGGYTLMRHVLPNVMGPLAALSTSLFGWVILSESALSFLGVGIAPPTPTWGNMLAGARPFLETAAWLGIAPGAFIALTLLSVNLVSDGLRAGFDPRTVA